MKLIHKNLRKGKDLKHAHTHGTYKSLEQKSKYNVHISEIGSEGGREGGGGFRINEN